MRQEQWDRMQEQLSEPWIPGTGQVPRKGKWDWSSKWYEVPKKGRDTLVSFSATMYRYRRNRFDEAVPDKVELRVKFDRTTHGRDSCKQVMDMLASGAKSPYFASLTPPLDTSVPRQNAVSISTKLLSDVVVPLAGMFGQMPPEAADPIETICGVLREMRMLNELQGDWTVSSLSLYLNPPA